MEGQLACMYVIPAHSIRMQAASLIPRRLVKSGRVAGGSSRMEAWWTLHGIWWIIANRKLEVCKRWPSSVACMVAEAERQKSQPNNWGAQAMAWPALSLIPVSLPSPFALELSILLLPSPPPAPLPPSYPWHGWIADIFKPKRWSWSPFLLTFAIPRNWVITHVCNSIPHSLLITALFHPTYISPIGMRDQCDPNLLQVIITFELRPFILVLPYACLGTILRLELNIEKLLLDEWREGKWSVGF